MVPFLPVTREPIRGRRPALGAALACLCLLMFVGPNAHAAVFTVNSNSDQPDSDTGDDSCSTGDVIIVSLSPFTTEPECTLRAAIEQANSSSGLDTVEFSGTIPTVAGVVEIRPTTELPWISDSIMIDGFSHPAHDSSDLFPTPIINLVGTVAGSNSSGLHFFPGSSHSTVRGLAISNFQRHGILVTPFLSTPGPDNLVIEGNDLGVLRGLLQSGNGVDGIRIVDSINSRIGQSCSPLMGCSGYGNLIAANGGNGIYLGGDFTGTRAAGNRIGTNRSGTDTSVPFGGETGNGGDGIHLKPAGTASFEIGSVGSLIGPIDGVPVPVVGGNLISGNDGSGIFAEGHLTGQVYANRIGTNASGTSALRNKGHGIEIVGSWSSGIGGEGAASNLISGNWGDGIHCVGDGVLTTVLGNRIGISDDATSVIGNRVGIYAACDMSIQHNIISGNFYHGVESTKSVFVTSNWIGTNSAGAPLGNSGTGIMMREAFPPEGEIEAAVRGNTIGFNTYEGIEIDVRTEEPLEIHANYIGTNETGQDLGNNGTGIYVSDALRLEIGSEGGISNGNGNVIGCNAGPGIRIIQSRSPENFIAGNYIGTNAEGDDLGNGYAGIAFGKIVGRNIQVGAPLTAADQDVDAFRNVVAFHDRYGVQDLSDEPNVIRGNQFFSNRLGAIVLGNDGLTPNDIDDNDLGANQLQNSPEFDADLTAYDDTTGEIQVRYRVDSHVENAAYPLKIDFYVRDPWLESGDQARVFIGSDSYPEVSAGDFRAVVITPLPGTVVPNPMGFVFESLVATATDAEGNTSELSVQPISVPEPGSTWLLGVGSFAIAGLGARRNRPRNGPLRAYLSAC